MRSPVKQRGSTLLVGLIMLVLMTLIAVTSFNLGKSNLQIVGNMQHRAESLEAAKSTLEEVISKTTFTTTPSVALTGGCATNSKCFDVNGDGTNDVSVALSPVPCIKKTQVIKNSQLDTDDPEQLKCIFGSSPIGDSLCADTTWEITAVATDSVTNASVTAVTGVAVRVSADSGTNAAFLCI